MKRERIGHDELSLEFSLDGDRACVELRMNSRRYGLRGYGDVYFDSRLDLAVDGVARRTGPTPAASTIRRPTLSLDDTTFRG